MGRASSTIKSYISVIKSILKSQNIFTSDNSYTLATLVKACKIKNDTLHVRLPIQSSLLHMWMDKVKEYFLQRSQLYLPRLYTAVLSTYYYYCLFRIGELTTSECMIKRIAKNKKKKIQMVLRSSKTHSTADYPQIVKIVSNQLTSGFDKRDQHCPFLTLRKFITERKKSYINF